VNEKNIEHLKARLLQLGFAASIEMELRCRICFSPGTFELVHTEVAAADLVRFVARVERGEKEIYSLLYYTASLRKGDVVPAEFAGMNQKMSAVNWKALVSDKPMVDKQSISEAFELLKELETIGAEADVLKFRHWVDTPLEILMPNLSALKNRYEILERFYLIDDTHTISFKEASRFLNNKWMERQIVAGKKLLVKKIEAEKTGGVGNGKLLTKNSRRSGRQGMVKK
jgi:hypothetical protein